MALLITLLVLGLIVAAFAAAAETSLTSVSRIRVRSLAEKGSRSARVVVRLHNDPNAYLSTILTLNNVAVIVASTTTALLIEQYASSFLQVISAIVLAVVVLIFCEIAPKSLALRFNERFALVLARPVQVLTFVLRPVVGGLTVFARLLVSVATRGRGVRGPFVTEEELKMLVYVGEQEGVVEQEEADMIQGILEMTDKQVREVMVPRVDVIAVEATRSAGDVIKLIIEYGYSRIPVYEENIDNIVGIVYAKDLLRHGTRSDDARPVRDLAREPYFTPDSKHVGELLREMKLRKVHIAVVVDEHGGTAGIVTLEDLIEEIVGPIRDEYDLREREEVQMISDHEVLVDARFPIDDLKEVLNLDLGDVEADTVGGLVYERLGEIPRPGATFQVDTATLTVEAVRRQRVQTVRITSTHPLIREHGARNGEREEGPPPESPAAPAESH